MTSQIKTDDIVARPRGDFLDDARDRLETVEGYLGSMRGGAGDVDELALGIRREVHNLKGMGGTFGFPSISLIAHLLEDYMASADEPITDHLANILIFHDTLTDIVNQGVDPGDAANAEIIRRLPIHADSDIEPMVGRDINVLLVIPSRSISQIISRSLTARGFRTSAVRTAAEAFDLAAVMRPDLVISSAVLGAISGTDLVRAFDVMSITANTRLAVATSFDRGHPELRNLSPNFDIVRLGATLEADLDHVTSNLEERPTKYA
ncbi:MAG: Hpt domain-containing protein [Alphaproteobacteria bacterium]